MPGGITILCYLYAYSSVVYIKLENVYKYISEDSETMFQTSNYQVKRHSLDPHPLFFKEGGCKFWLSPLEGGHERLKKGGGSIVQEKGLKRAGNGAFPI